MAFHRPAVFERSAKRRVRSAEKIFQLVSGEVQIKVVHVAAIHVDLAHELWADGRPALFQVKAEIITVVSHELRNREINLSRGLVPQRLWIAIRAGGAVNRLPGSKFLPAASLPPHPFFP